MQLVSDLKPGVVVDIEQKRYRVLEVVRHAGAGQAHGFIEMKLRDMQTGHVAEKHFKPTEKVTVTVPVRKQMEYLYRDTDNFYVMDPESFEQVAVPAAVIGPISVFLVEGTQLSVELLEGEPLAVQYPRIAELSVLTTGPGIRGGQDSTYKPATLENGIEILVPQFVESGERVRVDTETLKFVERVPLKKL
jgi:elongation factor P